MAKNKKRAAVGQQSAAVAAGRTGPFSWPAFLAGAAWLVVVLLNYKKQNYFFALNPFDTPLWLAHLDKAAALFKYLPQLALIAMLSVFSLMTGAVLLKAAAGAANEDIRPLDWFLFSLGLGFGTLSLLTLGLGFLGILNRTAFFALLGAGFLAGAARFRQDLRGQLGAFFAELKSLRFSGLDRVLLFLLFLSAASVLVLTFSPEIFFDSLVYHLGTPAYYIQEGRVLAEPGNLHSASPLLIQMLYAAALLISDDTLAKLVHFATGLFLCGTLFAIGRRYVSVTAGLLACVIFSSIPMAGLNLGATGVEIGSAWFTVLAAYALLLFSAREGGEPRVFDRTLLLAGVFAGLACGTKYPALFTVIAGAAVLFYRRPAGAGPRDTRLAAKQSLFFAVTAGVVFSPWLLKNIFFHGNPLYPYFGKIFGGQQIEPFKWAMLNSDCFSRDMGAVFKSASGFLHYIFHPWYLTMSGMGNADFIGPFMLLCFPLFFLLRARRPVLRHLAVFIAVMWGLWSVSTSMLRYLLPTLAVMSVLFAALIAELPDKVLKWALQGVLVAVSLFSAQWLNRMAASQDGWRVVFGLQDKAAYLSVQHDTYPTPYYPAMEYLNASLPADSRVLFVGESRGFYCRRKFVTASVYDMQPLVRLARASSTPEDLQARLASAGITHIFLNLAEAMRLADSYRLFQWDERSLKVFNAWWSRYAEPVWSDVRNNPAEFRFLFLYKVAASPRPGPEAYNHINELYRRSLPK